MSALDFNTVQHAVLAGAPPDDILKLLPAGARLVFDAPCPTCHSGYVGETPELAAMGNYVCLACGLEFTP